MASRYELYGRAYYYKTRERTKESRRLAARKSHLKKRYNLSIEEYDKMYEDCSGVCEICKTGEATHIDHNHDTGEVRGLLCSKCNNALGFANEDVTILQSMMDYINKWRVK